jgi:chromosomal replication initiation ATPase DnaA
MLIGRQYVGMSLRQIGEAIGSLSHPAVSDAVRRTTANSERNHSLQKCLRRAPRSLNLLDATLMRPPMRL